MNYTTLTDVTQEFCDLGPIQGERDVSRSGHN